MTVTYNRVLRDLDLNQEWVAQNHLCCQLHHHGLKGLRASRWRRTSNLSVFNRALYHLSFRRMVRTTGIEPARQPWQGRMQPEHLVHVEPQPRVELGTFSVPGRR